MFGRSHYPLQEEEKFIFDLCWDHYRYSTGKIAKFSADEKAEQDTDENPMQP